MELKKTEAKTLTDLLKVVSHDPALVTLNNETPRLSRIRVEHGIQTASKYVCELLTFTLTQFNIGRNMTDEQIVICAQDIVEEYADLNLYDIQTCFKRAEAGKYGKIIHGIDKAIVFGWLNKYCEEKMEDLVNHQTTKSQNFKQEVNGVFLGLEKLKLDKHSGYSIDNKIVNSGTITDEKPTIKNPYQKYFQEFDQIWKDLEPKPSGIRTILYDGKQLTQDEYVTYRFIEEKTKG